MPLKIKLHSFCLYQTGLCVWLEGIYLLYKNVSKMYTFIFVWSSFCFLQKFIYFICILDRKYDKVIRIVVNRLCLCVVYVMCGIQAS